MVEMVLSLEVVQDDGKLSSSRATEAISWQNRQRSWPFEQMNKVSILTETLLGRVFWVKGTNDPV